MNQTHQQLRNITGYQKSPNEFEIWTAVKRMFSNENHPSEIVAKALNHFIQQQANESYLITFQPLKETSSVIPKFNVLLKIKLEEEAGEDDLLRILTHLQAQLVVSTKYRIQFPPPSIEELEPLLLFHDSNIKLESDIVPQAFFLLQKYLSNPKTISYSAERFMDAYRILESYYTRCWKLYKKMLNAGEDICSKAYSGKVSELLKLYFVLNIGLENFSELNTKIKSAQERGAFQKYESRYGFLVGAVDTHNVKSCLASLALRWYTIRCALVHSDPFGWKDRREYAAYPVLLPGRDDLRFLDTEVQLMEYFALNFIALGRKKLKLNTQTLFNKKFRIPINEETLLEMLKPKKSQETV